MFAVGILTDFRTLLFPGLRSVGRAGGPDRDAAGAVAVLVRQTRHPQRPYSGRPDGHRGCPGRGRRHRARPGGRRRDRRAGDGVRGALSRPSPPWCHPAWSRSPAGLIRCPSNERTRTCEQPPGVGRGAGRRVGRRREPAIVLADVRWTLNGPPGRPDYEAGHLPGAVFVDLESELTTHGPTGGRHPLPDRDVFQQAMTAARGVRHHPGGGLRRRDLTGGVATVVAADGRRDTRRYGCWTVASPAGGRPGSRWRPARVRSRRAVTSWWSPGTGAPRRVGCGGSVAARRRGAGGRAGGRPVRGGERDDGSDGRSHPRRPEPAVDREPDRAGPSGRLWRSRGLSPTSRGSRCSTAARASPPPTPCWPSRRSGGRRRSTPARGATGSPTRTAPRATGPTP